ncbi:hypothetical protein COS70_02700 [Candidatus Micrarchaeota archaeon CG06_land_8_20_14_3_00_50_6]|nr:MAG: hypothetical protein COS70_02700 [Candidatus Micrarchaeota archaeon CG06_land_8_20_14_3_00_50_6]
MQSPATLREKYLAAHELNGLTVTVIGSPDVKRLGLSGLGLRETKNMFIIKADNNLNVSVPKSGCRFRFYVSGRGACELDGSLLCYAPESRTKKLLKGR